MQFPAPAIFRLFLLSALASVQIADWLFRGGTVLTGPVLAQLHLEDVSVVMCSVAGACLLWGLVGSSHAAVTISVGIAASGDDYPSPNAVISAADGKLYQAKKKGRNRLIY